VSKDQRIIDKKDGKVQVTATIKDSQQLRWWMLGFGDPVKVFKPRVVAGQIAEQNGASLGTTDLFSFAGAAPPSFTPETCPNAVQAGSTHGARERILTTKLCCRLHPRRQAPKSPENQGSSRRQR